MPYLLTLITFTPLIGLTLILLTDRSRVNLIKAYALGFSFIPLALSGWLYLKFDISQKGIQFEEIYNWIPLLNVKYHLGVDGLSLPLVCLTTLLTFVSILYSLFINERPKEFFAMFLLLEIGMVGVFVALDFFLFFIFWEVSLVPMYFIIGIWGGPRKEYAAIKFFIYTLVGSIAMLLSIIAIYFKVEPHSFDMLSISMQRPFAEEPIKRGLVFLGFFLAFAIKVPIFPFHTWLPDAHVEAPTAGSILLAGILLKMGTYGFVRVSLPILPGACQDFALAIAILAFINIVYGALVSMAQTDLKRLIAYSSINHMGYVMLGFAAASKLGGGSLSSKSMALTGSVLEMFNHGVITGSLFLLVGVLYERAHIRDLDAFGGLAVRVPIYYGFTVTMALASLGLPGLAGFISEFLVFLGSFSSFKLIVCFSVLGLLITAAFFIWMIQRIFLGSLNPRFAQLPDMDVREILSMLPLLLLTVLIGIYPFPIIKLIDTTIHEMLVLVH